VSSISRIFVQGGMVIAALVGAFLVGQSQSIAGDPPGLKQAHKNLRGWLDQAEKKSQSRADEEKKDWRHDREALERRVAAARETVLQSFDVYDRGILATSPAVREKFRKSKERRDNLVHRYLEYAADYKGSIASGEAQNFFLELCGSSAFADQFSRTAKQPNAKKDPDQNFLSFVTAEYRLNGDIIRHLIFKRGLTGPLLTSRFNQDPLDTTWPEVLRTRDFLRRTAEIEKCRDAVMLELHAGKPVSAERADALLQAVNDLLIAVKEKKQALMHEVRQRGTNDVAQREWIRFHAAEKRLQALLQGAYRLIEARTVDDVKPPPLDEKNGVTIEELMAYMQTNNLYFSPSDLNGEPAYKRVFDLMTRYYIDLVTLKNVERGLEAAQEEEKRIAQANLSVEWLKKLLLANRGLSN
jgi:hypothetical protein